MSDNIAEILAGGKIADLKRLASDSRLNHTIVDPTLLIQIPLRINKEVRKQRPSGKIIYYLLELLVNLNYKEATDMILGLIQACVIHQEGINIRALDLCNLTRAYIRLKRNDLSDLKPIFELLEYNNVNVYDAVSEVLGYDRMMPTNEEISLLIQIFWDKRAKFPMQTGDPRYGLAAACAGWKPEMVDDFLYHCLETGDPTVKYVAENSLKRKYVKLRSIAYF